MTITLLGNDELLTSTRALIRHAQMLDADLLLHLVEMEARRLHLELGFSSLYEFCVQDLGLSEDVACSRIELARLSRRLPGVLEYVRSGQIHLTGLRLLAPHLTSDNHVEALAAAAGKTKRQIEEQVATLAPRPVVPDSIRKLPQPRLADLFNACPASTNVPPRSDLSVQPSEGVRSAPCLAPSPMPMPMPMPMPSRRPRMEALAADAYKVQFTANGKLRDKLQQAKDLLRHQVRDGDLAIIIEQAVDLLIAKVKKERFGIVKKPRAQAVGLGGGTLSAIVDPPAIKAGTEASGGAPQGAIKGTSIEAKGGSEGVSPSSIVETLLTDLIEGAQPVPATRHIPNSMKRQIYERDGGRCTFVSGDGRRCSETGWLTFDHLDGFARTHEHSIERIALKCTAHNQHAADQMYGHEFMQRARAINPSRRG